MNTTRLLLILLLIPLYVLGQSKIYNVTALKIKKPYAETSPLAKYRYDKASYEIAQHQTAYIFEKFNYISDGLEITGFSCRPKEVKGRKIPVIIYNRGGTGNLGSLTEEDLPDFYALAKNGFAVYASNYRFVGKLGAIDQLGGNDVNDVLNLLKVVKRLDFIDTQNVFMMGVSRGGLMTYKSLTKININAAVVLGGVADFEKLIEKRPIFLTGWTDLSEAYNYKGLSNVLSNFTQNKKKYLRERSATRWAAAINTPVYILHSRQDGRVPVEGALALAVKLNELKKSYQAKIYEERSHSLPYSKFDSFEEIIKWFQKHLK